MSGMTIWLPYILSLSAAACCLSYCVLPEQTVVVKMLNMLGSPFTYAGINSYEENRKRSYGI